MLERIYVYGQKAYENVSNWLRLKLAERRDVADRKLILFHLWYPLRQLSFHFAREPLCSGHRGVPYQRQGALHRKFQRIDFSFGLVAIKEIHGGKPQSVANVSVLHVSKRNSWKTEKEYNKEIYGTKRWRECSSLNDMTREEEEQKYRKRVDLASLWQSRDGSKRIANEMEERKWSGAMQWNIWEE